MYNTLKSLLRYTFYDGPPFATGMPHYGHILAGTIKVKAWFVTSSSAAFVAKSVIGCTKE